MVSQISEIDNQCITIVFQKDAAEMSSAKCPPCHLASLYLTVYMTPRDDHLLLLWISLYVLALLDIRSEAYVFSFDQISFR